ncbi:MAG: FkbM family methyltransferase, partial [Planctomycetes bacterium]|nr:FkbM family methyltransferase [Planctomycetota bacterium]
VFTKNCADYPNIELVQAAIWGCTGNVRIKDIGLGSWGFVVEEAEVSDPQAVAAVTIEELFRRSGKPHIDILKLDIEGAEKEVFSANCTPWLDKVKVLIIELHDHLTPGCEAAFHAAIEHHNFQRTQRGENIILVKREL